MQNLEDFHASRYTTLARLVEDDQFQYPSDLPHQWKTVNSINVLGGTLQYTDEAGIIGTASMSDNVAVIKQIPSTYITSLNKELIGEPTIWERLRRVVSKG